MFDYSIYRWVDWCSIRLKAGGLLFNLGGWIGVRLEMGGLVFDYRWVDWCCIIYIWVDRCLIIGGVDWCSNLDGWIIV